MVKVSKSGLRQLQSAEADVIEGFVVEKDTLVDVLDELVEGKGCIVGLNNHVGDLWGWHD